MVASVLVEQGDDGLDVTPLDDVQGLGTFNQDTVKNLQDSYDHKRVTITQVPGRRFLHTSGRRFYLKTTPVAPVCSPTSPGYEKTGCSCCGSLESVRLNEGTKMHRRVKESL